MTQLLKSATRTGSEPGKLNWRDWLLSLLFALALAALEWATGFIGSSEFPETLQWAVPVIGAAIAAATQWVRDNRQ